MGATTFIEVGEGQAADSVFTRLRDAAAYEHGHGGYTGTIAEKDGFEVIDPEPYETVDDAINRANQLIDAKDARIDDKWGPAGCLKVKTGEFVFFGWASE